MPYRILPNFQPVMTFPFDGNKLCPAQRDGIFLFKNYNGHSMNGQLSRFTVPASMVAMVIHSLAGKIAFNFYTKRFVH